MRKLYALPIALLFLSPAPAHAEYAFSITFQNGKLVAGTANTKDLCLQEVGRNAMIYGKIKRWKCVKTKPGVGVPVMEGIAKFYRY